MGNGLEKLFGHRSRLRMQTKRRMSYDQPRSHLLRSVGPSRSILPELRALAFTPRPPTINLGRKAKGLLYFNQSLRASITAKVTSDMLTGPCMSSTCA